MLTVHEKPVKTFPASHLTKKNNRTQSVTIGGSTQMMNSLILRASKDGLASAPVYCGVSASRFTKRSLRDPSTPQSAKHAW